MENAVAMQETTNKLSYINTADMEKQEWLEQRKRGIGGSEAATVMGLNPYETPYSLWETKTGRKEPKDLSENEAVIFGNLLEDVVADEFTRRTGRKVRRDNKIRIHPEHPHLLANIDRLIVSEGEDGPGILEIKTTNSFVYKDWEMGVPEQYYCQIQHYFSVTGYKYGAFAILIDGRKLEIREVKPGAKYIAFQNEYLSQWYQTHIVEDIAPEKLIPDLSLTRHREGQIVEGDENAANIYEKLVTVKQQIKALETEEEKLSDMLKMQIGEAEGIAFGATLLATWKMQESNRFDSTAFKKQHPELHKQFTKPSTSRVFRLKELK